MVEFADAISGFNDLEDERVKLQLWMTRKICFYAARPHIGRGSEFNEEDIIPIPELDEQIKKARLKSLPQVKVIEDGSEQ